jgi:hypothetical protein
MPKIFKLSDINFDDINYSKPVDGTFLKTTEYNKGYYISYISYKNEPLLIEIPSLYFPDDYKNDNELLLPLNSKENKYDTDLNNFFSNLDKNIIKNVSKILKTLKIKSKGMNYNAILKSVDNDDNLYKNGAIQIKILPETKLYDPNKQIIEKELYSSVITRGSYIGSIIQLVSIMVNHEQILVNVKVHQMRVSYVIPNNISLFEYSFLESEEEQIKNDINTLLSENNNLLEENDLNEYNDSDSESDNDSVIYSD